MLTKPSERADNQGWDNRDHDYILYVHDVISSPRGANRYQVLDLLGKGTFGQVVKCLDLEKNEFVAIKIVKNLPAFHSQGLVEVKLLQTLNSKYDSDIYPMVRMLDNFIFRNHLCLVFELLNVSLYELIRQNQFRGLSVQLVSIFTKQILTAMVALHQSRIIHCDLKPENILLEDATSPNLKVIDFGSACFDNQAVYTYIQSRFYRSPEVILGLPYKLSIDVWSLGCIVFELFIGLPLFPGLSQHRMLMRFIKFVGMPPYRMLIEAKDTSKFFNRIAYNGNSADFVLKTDEEYSRHIAALTGNKPVPAQPFREYYKAGTIHDIVIGYDMKANLTRAQKEEELAMRRCMLSFINCVLPWDPEERWTPEQLLTHPFINGDTLPEGPLNKPSKAACDALNPLLKEQAVSAERALTASSTMVVAGALVTLPAQQQNASASMSSQSSAESPQSSNTPANSTTGSSNRMDSAVASGSNTPSSYNSSPTRTSSSGSGSSASYEVQAIGVYSSNASETPGQRSGSFSVNSSGSAGFLSAGSTPGATLGMNPGVVTSAQMAVSSGRVQHQHPGPHSSQPGQRQTHGSATVQQQQPVYGSRATSSSSGSSSGSAAMLLQSPSGNNGGAQYSHIPSLGTGVLASSGNGRGGVPITPMKAGKVPTLPGLGTSPSSYMSGQSPLMGKLGLSPREMQHHYQSSQAAASNPSLMVLDESGTPTMNLGDQGDMPISLSSSSSMSSPAHAIVELSHHNALDSPTGAGKRMRSQTGGSTGNWGSNTGGGSTGVDPFGSVFDSPNNSPAMNTSISKRHKMTSSDPSSPIGGHAGRRHGVQNQSPRSHYPDSGAPGTLQLPNDTSLESFDDGNMVTLMDLSSPMKPSTNWNNNPASRLGGTPEHVFPSSSAGANDHLQRAQVPGTDMVVDFTYMSPDDQDGHSSNFSMALQPSASGNNFFMAPAPPNNQQAQQQPKSGKRQPKHQASQQQPSGHPQMDVHQGIGDLEDNLTFWDGQEALGDYSQQQAPGYYGRFTTALGYPQSAAQQQQQRSYGQGSGFSSAPGSGHYAMAPGSTGSLSAESRAPFPPSNSLLVPGSGNAMDSRGGNGAAFGLGVSPYESGFGQMSGGSGSGHHFFSGSFSSTSSSFAQPTLGSSFSSQGNLNSGWGSSYSSSMEQGSAFSSSFDQGSNYGGYGGAGSSGSYSALQTSGLPPMSSYLVSPSSSDQFLKRVPQQQQQQQQQQPAQQSSPRTQHSSHTSPPSSRTFRRQHDTIQ